VNSCGCQLPNLLAILICLGSVVLIALPGAASSGDIPLTDGDPLAEKPAATIPLGSAYQGPKATIAVGEFSCPLQGAPEGVGDGLREMLMTALYESNYFIVLDRLDTAGISAEKLLSKSFLANADNILNQKKMMPAELQIYGALTAMDAGGWGIRVKVPNAPATFGGAYHSAQITIEFRVVDSATGKILAAQSISGTTHSGRALAGTGSVWSGLPVQLEAFANTPVELAIRDCIYRAVIKLIKAMPADKFRHKE
jgi:curli biogenesis system outer membrane secretion channel CsgG